MSLAKEIVGFEFIHLKAENAIWISWTKRMYGVQIHINGIKKGFNGMIDLQFKNMRYQPKTNTIPSRLMIQIHTYHFF